MAQGSAVHVLLLLVLSLSSTPLTAQQEQAAVADIPVSLVRAQSSEWPRSVPGWPGMTSWERADEETELPAAFSATFQAESRRPIWVLPLAGAVVGGLIAKCFNPVEFAGTGPKGCGYGAGDVLRGAALGAVAGFLLDGMLQPADR